MTRKKNQGWFKPGTDARRRAGFTKAECQRGYQAALKKCLEDVHKHAWLWRRLRGHYRAKGTWYPQLKGTDDGPEENARGDERHGDDVPY